MSVSFNAALNAYKNAAQMSANSSSVTSPAPENVGGGFSNVVNNLVSKTSTSLRNVDSTTAKFLTKQADITDVVTAITNAELMLKTVMEIRDRLVSAHQDIMKMPI
jgi:flagellar hook-basal body complex protein FliE